MRTREQLKWDYIEDHIKNDKPLQFKGMLNSIHSGIPLEILEGPSTEPWSIIKIQQDKSERHIRDYHIIIPYRELETKQAIDTIINANTLPSQIDYRVPYQIQANKAQEFIDTLPSEERNTANMEIATKIDEYNDSDASYYDSLF